MPDLGCHLGGGQRTTPGHKSHPTQGEPQTQDSDPAALTAPIGHSPGRDSGGPEVGWRGRVGLIGIGLGVRVVDWG